MIIVGIDPGLKGAVAILNLENKMNWVFNIPIHPRGDIKGKNEVNFRELYLHLEPLSLIHDDVRVYLESVHAMPGQGVTSMFSMGHTFGGIRGVIASLGFPVELISPQKWKKHFGLNKDKELSRSLAIKHFPDMAGDLKRKKDSDRAEALLIALYGSIHAEVGKQYGYI